MSESATPTASSILAERARALARPLERPPEGDEIDVVTFSVRGETFGAEARYVREVTRLRHLVALPGAPWAVRGVTAYRGEILAAVDVGALAGLRGGGLGDLLWLIVLGTTAAEFGLLADEVAGVARVRVEGLRSVSEDASPALRRLARGITADAATVLDGAALLAERELFTTAQTATVDAGGDQGRERDRSNDR